MERKKVPSEQHMVIAIFAKDKPGILHRFGQFLAEYHCHIEKSRMTVLGSEVSMNILVSGTWSALAKLETQLPDIEKKLRMQIIVKRTKLMSFEDKHLIPYTVELMTIYREGAINEISEFFANYKVNIYDLRSDTYVSHTGVKMASFVMRVYIPIDYRIAELRENFILLCEELNIDAIIEPERI